MPLAPVVEEEHQPSAPSIRVQRRRKPVGVLITALAVGAAWLFLHANAPTTSAVSGCPRGTISENTALEEICTYPDGKVLCTLSAAGFTPNPTENSKPNRVYAINPPEGVWCRNAHDWQE